MDLPNAKDTVYLGQANSTVVLCDRSRHVAIRYPASDVAVTIDPTTPTCTRVH